jgi:transcriptional regulator with XRE-family HTH domain
MRPTFSEQLRQAVRGCGTTCYALAKQLGIAESTLSRFLSGERGLTLDLLDKLADVLGLKFMVAVQTVNRPSKRGPKHQGAKQMKDMALISARISKALWHDLARFWAEEAGENHFPSRRGVWFLDKLGVLCVYNNHPYAAYPTLRDQETEEFRAWLKQKRIKELGYATYPESGQDAGYTYAMLLDAGEDRQQEVVDALQEIIMKSIERRYGPSRD